jgi:YVTN family beta-propeller protein
MNTSWYRNTVIAAALLLVVACAAYDDAGDLYPGDGNNQTPGQNNNNNNNNNNGGSFEPEKERDYTFSQPAVFGQTLFVANETLNSVVWIDSESLTIRTIPVGFRPTKIAGPTLAAASAADARIYVLNQGNSSVSIIDPASRTVLKTLAAQPRVNALAAAPDGASALAWYDDSEAVAGQLPGDLSSVTVLRGEAAYQVAVGFHVRRVVFTQDGARALVLTDDGISVITLADVRADQLAIPVPLVPRSLRELSPRDLEVQISRDGRYAITRTTAFPGLVLLDLMSKAHTLVRLPETPTDIDLAQRAGELEVLVMLRGRSELARISVPAGFEALAAAQAAVVMADDMGLDMDPDMPDDMADPDMDPDMDPGMADPDMELDMPDGMADPDMAPDMDMDEDMAPDMAVEPGEPLPMVAGVQIVALDATLGAAAVSGNGEQALLYSTLNGLQIAALLDLGTGALRQLFLEKGVQGVLPDEGGQTFIIFHTRQPGERPVGATPADPEFIARSWGVSVVDVASAINRLVLTEQEPGGATLWREEGADARAYLIFKAPSLASLLLPAHRDVVEINMVTFGIDSLRVPSVPQAIGPVPGTGRIYISQEHPRGRMTFLDVISRKRQTVTGYQLNAGID